MTWQKIVLEMTTTNQVQNKKCYSFSQEMEMNAYVQQTQARGSICVIY
jgi:hypothetical protein